MKKRAINLFFIIPLILLFAQPVLAESPLADLPCFSTGDCGLCDVLYGFLKLAYWGLGIMGSVALLAFIVGGLYWFTAAGDKNKITKGKSILTGTVMGIIIILSAFLIINFVIYAFTRDIDNPQKWGLYLKNKQLKEWYDVCDIKIQK